MPEPNVNLANEKEIDRWKKLSIRSKFSADAVFGGKETFERLRNLIYGDEKKRKEDEKADTDELDVRNLFMVYCLSRDDTTPSIVYHADKRLLDKCWLILRKRCLPIYYMDNIYLFGMKWIIGNGTEGCSGGHFKSFAGTSSRG